LLSTWQGTLSNGGQRGLRLGVDMDVVDIRSPFRVSGLQCVGSADVCRWTAPWCGTLLSLRRFIVIRIWHKEMEWACYKITLWKF